MSLNYATTPATMTPRNWFGVGVRLLGLWEILLGIDEVVTYGDVILRIYRPSLTRPEGYLTHAIAHLLIGLFLLFAAMNVVHMVYSDPTIETEEQRSEETAP